MGDQDSANQLKEIEGRVVELENRWKIATGVIGGLGITSAALLAGILWAGSQIVGYESTVKAANSQYLEKHKRDLDAANAEMKVQLRLAFIEPIVRCRGADPDEILANGGAYDLSSKLSTVLPKASKIVGAWYDLRGNAWDVGGFDQIWVSTDGGRVTLSALCAESRPWNHSEKKESAVKVRVNVLYF